MIKASIVRTSLGFTSNSVCMFTMEHSDSSISNVRNMCLSLAIRLYVSEKGIMFIWHINLQWLRRRSLTIYLCIFVWTIRRASDQQRWYWWWLCRRKRWWGLKRSEWLVDFLWIHRVAETSAQYTPHYTHTLLAH